jgi:DNA-directed RNA polymerase subunit N (RpoN/RPB10)
VSSYNIQVSSYNIQHCCTRVIIQHSTLLHTCHHTTFKCHHTTFKCHHTTFKCHHTTFKCHHTTFKCHHTTFNTVAHVSSYNIQHCCTRVIIQHSSVIIQHQVSSYNIQVSSYNIQVSSYNIQVSSYNIQHCCTPSSSMHLQRKLRYVHTSPPSSSTVGGTLIEIPIRHRTPF